MGDADYSVDYNLEELQSFLDLFPDDTYKHAKYALRKGVVAAHKEVSDRFGTDIQSRTGTLRRSLGSRVSGDNLATLEASIYAAARHGGKAMVYTLAQEFGDTITATDKYIKVPGGPYLNIPVYSNLTPAGVMRMSAREVFKRGGYIAKSKAGAWGVFIKGKMMFVLKTEVKLEPRLGMRDAAETQLPLIIKELKSLIGTDA